MAMIPCPQCGAEYDAAELSCPRCGLTSTEAPAVVTGAGRDAGPTEGAPFEALETELRAALAPRLLLVSLLGHGGIERSIWLATPPSSATWS